MKYCRALCPGVDSAPTDVFPRACRVECLANEVETSRCDLESIALLAPAPECPPASAKGKVDTAAAVGIIPLPTKPKTSVDSQSDVTQMRDVADGAVYTATWFIIVVYVLLPIIVVLCILSFICGVIRHCLFW